MPFTLMSLGEKSYGVSDCVKHGNLQPYLVSNENLGNFVAQIKFTVLVMQNGSDMITSSTLQKLNLHRRLMTLTSKGGKPWVSRRKKLRKNKKRLRQCL